MRTSQRFFRRLFCGHSRWWCVREGWIFSVWKCRRCGKVVERRNDDPPPTAAGGQGLRVGSNQQGTP